MPLLFYYSTEARDALSTGGKKRLPGWRNGIRATLKMSWSKGLVGSSPTLGTIDKRAPVRCPFINLSVGGIRTPESKFSVENFDEAVARAPASDGEQGTRGRVPPWALIGFTDHFSLEMKAVSDPIPLYRRDLFAF